MEKYLFLYLKTGGGHLAPAKAIAEKITRRHHSDVEITLADGLAQAPGIVKRVIEDGYKTSINGPKWIFEFLYLLHKLDFISSLTSRVCTYFMKEGIRKYIMETNPDKIVIFHFFLIQPVNEVISTYNLKISVITVVTDPFTAHPIWFLDKSQNFIVFSELLKEKCISGGINGTQLKVFPFVLDSRYSRKLDIKRQKKIRAALGFHVDSKIILILGGGDGIPKGKTILRKIVKSNMNAEIAIVCGRNKKLFHHASKLKNKYSINNLKVYGFIEFVHSLISISDIVVTKCGASSSMEILLMGKIPVINDYIWEQEKGNMEFVCKGRMGVLEKKTGNLPEVINCFLSDNGLYKSFQNNIKKAGLRNGVEHVSEYILNFQ